MAWTEPMTDRTQTSRCTYEDMNRISGNINYLQDSALKDDYTNDDIVTLVQWQSIVQGVADCCLKYGILMETPVDESTTASNFNQAETYLGLCYNVKEQIELLKQGTLFVGNTGAYTNAPTYQMKGVF